MKRTTLTILGVVAALLLLVAFVLNQRAADPGTSTRSGTTAITIAQAGDFYLYAPLYVAVDRGLFAARGLSIAIVSTGGDDKTWAAVIGGSAQFGVADPTFVAIASQRGQPGRVIATMVNGVPFWGITKDGSLPQITNPAQLKGHTVATFPAPSTAYTLQRRMFEMAGLQPSIREGAFGTLGALLESGQADIALELEPNVSASVAKGYKILYSLADVYGDFTITGLTTTPDYIRNNRKTIEAVISGLQEALDFIRSNPTDAASLLAKRFPEISSDVATAALKRVVDAGIIPTSTRVSREAWTKALQLRVDVGDVKPVDEPMEFVDTSFSAGR